MRVTKMPYLFTKPLTSSILLMHKSYECVEIDEWLISNKKSRLPETLMVATFCRARDLRQPALRNQELKICR